MPISAHAVTELHCHAGMPATAAYPGAPAPGAQWELGASATPNGPVFHSPALLERRRTGDEVCELVLEGADRGVPKEERSAGHNLLRRSIPTKRALEPDVLIAYAMNGQDLTPDHGYPCAPSCPGTTAWRR